LELVGDELERNLKIIRSALSSQPVPTASFALPNRK
jgi:hypothetical protein